MCGSIKRLDSRLRWNDGGFNNLAIRRIMKYSEAKQGRVFIVRLEDGEIVHEVLEQFAVDHGIRAASLIVVSGADDGSRFVVGPLKDRG